MTVFRTCSSNYLQCTPIPGHVHRPRQWGIWQACHFTSALCRFLCAALAWLYPSWSHSHSYWGTYADVGWGVGVGRKSGPLPALSLMQNPLMEACGGVRKRTTKKNGELEHGNAAGMLLLLPLFFCSFSCHYIQMLFKRISWRFTCLPLLNWVLSIRRRLPDDQTGPAGYSLKLRWSLLDFRWFRGPWGCVCVHRQVMEYRLFRSSVERLPCKDIETSKYENFHTNY